MKILALFLTIVAAVGAAPPAAAAPFGLDVRVGPMVACTDPDAGAIDLATVTPEDLPGPARPWLAGRQAWGIPLLLRSRDGTRSRLLVVEGAHEQQWSQWDFDFLDVTTGQRGTLWFIPVVVRSSEDYWDFMSWNYPMGGGCIGIGGRRPEHGSFVFSLRGAEDLDLTGGDSFSQLEPGEKFVVHAHQLVPAVFRPAEPEPEPEPRSEP